MKKRLLLCFLLISLALPLCACQSKPSDDGFRETSVVFQINCDEDVYGVTFEYCLDRQRLGGMTVSANPEMDTPLRNSDPLWAKFDERGFTNPEDLSEKAFGIMIFVHTAGGESILIESLYEWNAAYGAEYHFTLSGNSGDGFAFEPSNGDIACTITPYSELPEDFF